MSRTILITGASSGIGKAIAGTLAAPGINLVLNSRHNQAGLEAVAQNALARGAHCLAVCGDVSDYEFCRRLYREGLRHFGRIDVLINNAGISHIGLFQDMKPEEWQRILDVNLGSVINLCHLAVPDMVARHSGRIISISSVWGCAGASCETVYSASKGAVNSFTKALAKELAPSGIQVNALACGAIDTPMNGWLSPEEEDALREEIPAGRMGSAKEAAHMVQLLLDAPDYLTGQIITLDGAWL